MYRDIKENGKVDLLAKVLVETKFTNKKFL